MVTRVQGLIHWWAGISPRDLQNEQSAVIEARLPRVQPSEVTPNQQAHLLGPKRIHINISGILVDAYRQARSSLYVVDEKLCLGGLAFSIDDCPQRKALQRAAHTVKNACFLTGIATLAAGVWSVYSRKSSLISIAAAVLTGATFWSARQAGLYVKSLTLRPHFLVSQAIESIVTIIKHVTEARDWVAAVDYLLEPHPSPLKDRLLCFLTGTNIQHLILESAKQGAPWTFLADKSMEWLNKVVCPSVAHLREGLPVYQQVMQTLSTMTQEATFRLENMQLLLTQHITNSTQANSMYKEHWASQLRAVPDRGKVERGMNSIFTEHLKDFCRNLPYPPTQQEVQKEVIEEVLESGLNIMVGERSLSPPEDWEQTARDGYCTWIQESLQNLRTDPGSKDAKFLANWQWNLRVVPSGDEGDEGDDEAAE
jgi:hypothetical protein